MRGSWVRRARHWIENRGWRGFLAEMWRRTKILLHFRRRTGAETRATRAVHPFDEQNGVETGGLVWGERLDTRRDEAYWATAYYGISPSVFRGALDRLGLVWGRYTFADVGCGKGRALMLATGYPFRAAWGVELSPELAARAKENLARFAPDWRRGEVPVEVVCGDAAEAPLPAGPLVISLYHPFAAPVMRRFLAHLEASLREEPREMWLLYTNPELHGMLCGMPWLRVAWDECLPMSEEDQSGDRFGSTWERIVTYRTVEG